MSHPLMDKEIHRKTYEALCKKICKFYGVIDAERFYQAKRKSILDKCESDDFGFRTFATLKDWHEARVLVARVYALHDAA